MINDELRQQYLYQLHMELEQFERADPKEVPGIAKGLRSFESVRRMNEDEEEGLEKVAKQPRRESLEIPTGAGWWSIFGGDLPLLSTMCIRVCCPS